MSDTIYSIYKVTNALNQKAYIGITSKNPPERRWKEHINTSNRTSFKSYIHRAIKHHGLSNFTFEILCQTRNKECAVNELETYFIIKYNTLRPNGYNLTLGGEGSSGYKHSKSTKKMLSLRGKSLWSDPEYHKRQASRTKTGYTPAVRKKMSDLKKLHVQDPKVKRQMSLAQKRRFKNPIYLERYLTTRRKFVYEITYPDGQKEITDNLKQFALTHKLNQGRLSQVAMGHERHHKKFKVRKLQRINHRLTDENKTQQEEHPVPHNNLCTA